MWLAALVLSGGLVYWTGLVTHQRAVLSAGIGALVLSLLVMHYEGSIEPSAIPFLLTLGLLVVALRCQPTPVWQVIGWILFVVIALALGFRLFPFFTPVDTVQTVEHGFRFPPEKVVLMLLVPPMVLALGSTDTADGTLKRPGRSGWVALLMLVGTLVLVTPIAWFSGFIKPGLAPQSTTYLAYWLAYNLIYTCILEESFFRGIVQTALIRMFSRIFSATTALAAGVVAASLLFGLAHIGGGLSFVILATLAGVGYGLTYVLTGRLQYAVLVHFAVNTVHHLVFAGATAGG